MQQIILDAPLQPNGWDVALCAVASATRSARAQILGIGGPRQLAFNHIANLGDSRHIDEFLEIGGTRADVNWRLALVGPPMALVHDADYASYRSDPRYSVYNDFARKYDMMHGCQAVLERGRGGRLIGLATLRTAADGVMEADDLALFAAMAPTILDAIRMQQAIEHQGAELLAGALEAMEAAIILVGALGEVIAMTRAAEAHVRAQEAVAMRDRQLRAVDRTSDARLQDGLARVLAAPVPAMTGQLWLASVRGPARGLVAELYALPAQEWNLGTAPCALVALRSIAISGGDGQMLRQAFDLSAAEADVAMLVAQGFTREEIAARRKVSPETVATQLKTIYRKAGVNSQVQLATLVARMAGR